MWKGSGPIGSKSHEWLLNHGNVEAQVLTLLPTPRATDATKGGPNQKGSSGDLMLPSAVQESRWGAYGAAVSLWQVLTRTAPEPTIVGKNGGRQLSARFTEWMMGLLDGWVTEVPGITRNQALKMHGNGVVPQQAAEAIRRCLDDLTWEA